jgi:hypothetical protein
VIRFFALAFIAATLTAQSSPSNLLSRLTIRNVTCEITETAAREGIEYNCSQVGPTGLSSLVARGTLIPITASVTTTVTSQTPSATVGAPPDQNTFVITANRAGVGASGTTVLSWGVSTNGTIQ